MRGSPDFFKRCESGPLCHQLILAIVATDLSHVLNALDHTALCIGYSTLIMTSILQLITSLTVCPMHRTMPSSCMSQHTRQFDRCYKLAQFQLSLKAQFQAHMSGYLSSLSILWNSLMHIIHGSTPTTRLPISLHSLVVSPQFAELSGPFPLRLAPLPQLRLDT